MKLLLQFLLGGVNAGQRQIVRWIRQSVRSNVDRPPGTNIGRYVDRTVECCQC